MYPKNPGIQGYTDLLKKSTNTIHMSRLKENNMIVRNKSVRKSHVYLKNS